MNFGMIMLNQIIKTVRNYAIWILTALLFTLKLTIFYKDIVDDVENWFDTFNYSEDDKRPLPIDINKKVIGLFKDKLGGKIMKEHIAT